MIDPGPDLPAHLERVAVAVSDASEVHVVVTHDHGDHAGGAEALADLVGCRTWGPVGSRATQRTLSSGDSLPTDWGDLKAIATPGHTEHHIALHWADGRAVFVGDLVLGEGDATWVGAYAGCVADYLASLEKVEELKAEILYPSHGPPLTDPAEAIGRFRAHRLARLAEVEELLHLRPEATADELADEIYREVPSDLWRAAVSSVAALVAHVGSTE